MNCRRYRACLMGIIAVAAICGMLVFIRYGKERRIPAEGTLVEQEQDDEVMEWA